MQPPPTSMFMHADARRQELIADFERARPKVRRGRAGRSKGPSSIVGESTGEHPAPDTDERMNGRVLVALCIASFLVALNFLATTPFYLQIARDLDTTVALLGQVVTLMILISAVLGLGVGPIADRYGYRWPLVVGMFAIAVNLAGTGLAPSYSVLLGLSVTGGLADALVFGLPLAIASASFSGDARRRAMGWTFGSLSIGAIVGVPLLTAIGAVVGWRGALIAGGFGAAGAAWFVAVALPKDGRRPTTRWRARELLASYAPMLRHPPSLLLYGVTALRAACWLGLLTYLGAFLGNTLGLGTRQIGLVYALAGGGCAVGSFAAGGRLGRITPRTLVAVTIMTVGILIGLMLLIADVWLALPLLFLISVASAVSAIGIVTLLADETPAGSGTAMVLNGSLINFGGAGGAAVGGVLIAAGGYRALGLGLMLLALAASALVCWPAVARFSRIRAQFSQGLRSLTAGRQSVGPALLALLRVPAISYQQAISSWPGRSSRWRDKQGAEADRRSAGAQPDPGS
jgi:predicted MFS family arabinose efflux permease